MISIIISSYKTSFYNQLIENISETIGVPYEIVKIDNPGMYSLAKAYNICARRAKFEMLCFVHEDVLFHTSNWGKILLSHFRKTPKLGLIGLIGSKIKTSNPTGWNDYQGVKNRGKLVTYEGDAPMEYKRRIYNQKLEFVKVLDGVFLATTKSIWNIVKFDESINGYHMYDIDFSLRVAQSHQVAVVNNIFLEHFSTGNFGEDWVKAVVAYHKRTDKAHLFDHKPSDFTFSSKFYIKAITGFQISFRTKLLYLRYLHFKWHDVPTIFYFLLPENGRKFYRFLKKS